MAFNHLPVSIILHLPAPRQRAYRRASEEITDQGVRRHQRDGRNAAICFESALIEPGLSLSGTTEDPALAGRASWALEPISPQ
jgi:hypothetical protein